MRLELYRWRTDNKQAIKDFPDAWGCLMMIVFCLLLSTPASAVNISVNLETILPSIKLSPPYRLTNDGLQLNISRTGQLSLPLTKVRTISFDFIADGNFQVEGFSLPANAGKHWLPSPLYVQRCLLERGSGQCFFDLRRSPEWESDNLVLLHFIGTGTVTLRNLVIDGLEVGAEHRAEHRWAMFWSPERIRDTTVNYLTPIYWDVEKQQSWTLVWGILTVGLILIARAAMAIWVPFRQRKTVLVVCLVCLLVYQIHWVIRFFPMVHKDLWLTNKEKIQRHYFLPEFGLLTAAALEVIPTHALVLISVFEDDWFSKQTLAFNLAPRKCGFDRKENGSFSGLSGFGPVSPSEADYFISFYGKTLVPRGFSRVFELNTQVYIARRNNFRGNQ